MLPERIDRSRPLSLYIHVPFCRAKCDYCAFYSVPRSRVDDDIVIQHIDATHPVRSYQYDELSRIDFDKDPDGFVTITEAPVTNDTVLDESEDLAIGTVTFLDLPILEK